MDASFEVGDPLSWPPMAVVPLHLPHPPTLLSSHGRLFRSERPFELAAHGRLF